MTPKQNTVNFLRHHFPEAEYSEIRATAYDLELVHSCANGMESVDRRTKPLAQDLRDLQKAVKALTRAETILKEVGLEGGALLVDVAYQLDLVPGDTFADLRPSSTAAAEILSDWLADLRTGIQSAMENQDRSAGVNATQSERRGAPTKTEATQFANYLYDTFQKLSGKTPTLSTDRITNEKYGPFLDFVDEAFKHFGVEGSAVNMARTACREKKVKT